MVRSRRVGYRLQPGRRVDAHGLDYFGSLLHSYLNLIVGASLNGKWIEIERLSGTLLGIGLIAVYLQPTSFWQGSLRLFRKEHQPCNRRFLCNDDLLLLEPWFRFGCRDD